MELFRERVCGIDIGKADVKACVRVPGKGQRRVEVTRTFSTTTNGLLLLRDWLAESRVELVGMESTGVYWKSLYYTLEDEFTCWLLNPQHVKKVPGRKTDVTDAQWLARLTEYGLVRASFVPPPPIRALRDLTRYRATLVHERIRCVQRLHALLEDAGIKLSLVASDITGVSSTAMLRSLIAGQRDPARLADLAKASMRRKIPALTEALTGHITGHHARLAEMMLRRMQGLDHDIADLEIQIQVQLTPFDPMIRRLMTIPGVGETVAPVILAELGPDMTQFPTAAHAASWDGLCPGNNESAGRRLGGRARKGNPHLRGALGEAAYAASHTKNTYLADSHHRLARRRGEARAVVATARKILEAAWTVLAHDVDYHDLGPDYLTRRTNPEQRARRLVHELALIGYQTTITPTTAA
jgi:transposase